jgi:hypothetical protein
MQRILLLTRSIIEAMAGFFLLLVVPFLGIDLLHSGAPMAKMLEGFAVLCVFFLAGLLLFRDAIQIRLRLKAKPVSE